MLSVRALNNGALINKQMTLGLPNFWFTEILYHVGQRERA